MDESAHASDTHRTRRTRSDGQRSREAILRESARLATIEGIHGISIARLAEAVGMSKSGLFAHFGSKEELQLATIDAARSVFDQRVVEPAAAGASGIERLHLLYEGFLQHLEDGVFPGGCFFASVAAELDTRPGPVRDGAMAVVTAFYGAVEAAIVAAQDEGALDPGEDPAQLAFELEAYLLLANAQFVATGRRAPLERARHALAARLGTAGRVAVRSLPRV